MYIIDASKMISNKVVEERAELGDDSPCQVLSSHKKSKPDEEEKDGGKNAVAEFDRHENACRDDSRRCEETSVGTMLFGASPTFGRGKGWKKVLYGGMQPGFEDNYTDSSFLEELVMNANVRKRRTWTVMRDAVALCQHICVVGLVCTVWKHSLDGVFLNARTLLMLDALILMLGFAILFLTTMMTTKTTHHHCSDENFLSSPSSIFLCRQHALNFSLFVTALYILSPIFQTLTRSISSDSIWALTVSLLLVHLLFHDYTYTTMDMDALDVLENEEPEILDSPGTPQIASPSLFPYASPSLSPGNKMPTNSTSASPSPPSPERLVSRGRSERRKRGPTGITFSANVSLNASVVASVLIASRLPDHLLVFALMLFSLEFFLLFPLVTHCMRRRSVNLHLAFCCTLIVVTMALIFPVSRLGFSFFVIVIFLITIVCPYWLIKIQEYKFEINGPWDEAKLCFEVGD